MYTIINLVVSSYDTQWISNVDNVIFVNKISEMVSFELGKEIEKDGKHLSLFLFLFLSRSFILSFTIDIPLIIEFKKKFKDI